MSEPSPPDTSDSSELSRPRLRELTVESVVDLAEALHQQVYAGAPENFPMAYNVALHLVNAGTVRVLIDGEPGFALTTSNSQNSA